MIAGLALGGMGDAPSAAAGQQGPPDQQGPPGQGPQGEGVERGPHAFWSGDDAVEADVGALRIGARRLVRLMTQALDSLQRSDPPPASASPTEVLGIVQRARGEAETVDFEGLVRSGDGVGSVGSDGAFDFDGLVRSGDGVGSDSMSSLAAASALRSSSSVTEVPVAVLASSPTGAAEVHAPEPVHVRRGRAALARTLVQPSSVGFTISFHPRTGGPGGLTYPDTRHIEIYVDPQWSDDHLAHVVAHEIGHAVDLARNSWDDRHRWKAARGIAADRSWWAGAYQSDFASPGGDFAECFAAWAVGSRSTRSHFGSCAGTDSLVAELARS